MGGWIGEWMDGWMNDAEEEEKRAPTRLLAALFFILPATHRTITRTRKSVPVRRNVRRPRRSSESGRSCRHADNPAVCFSDLCVRVYVQTLSLSLPPSPHVSALGHVSAHGCNCSAMSPPSDTIWNNNHIFKALNILMN